ncbi:hypothetical protein [Corynebacterium comes]|uniref:Uncharacterized protein n=1 Tax=Corynebacterium comes TaxID=2675218 RepID=A0A6B8VUT1_9CORY|nr:hypothetical protein [Corynebacterium comes]QGU05094.1 hypothetical protein CETAM_09205 [Corynebacterium comes]
MNTLDQNLVRRNNGKIHDVGCSHRPASIRPVAGTKGMTIQEVVAKYGTDLCSHCFPASVVERAQATETETAPVQGPEYQGTVSEEDGLLVVTVSKHPGQYDPNAHDVYAAANGEWVVTNPHSGTYRVSATLQTVSRNGTIVDTRYADHAHVLPAVRAGVEALNRYNEAEQAQQAPDLDTSGELSADDVALVVRDLRERGLIHGAVVGASPMTGETIAQVADVVGESWLLEVGPFGVWTDRDGTLEGHTTACENVWGAGLALAWAINADRDELAPTG